MRAATMRASNACCVQVESMCLRVLQQPPIGCSFADAVERFNANVPYSGLLHSVSADGLFAENKERLITACLGVIVMRGEGEQLLSANSSPTNATGSIGSNNAALLSNNSSATSTPPLTIPTNNNNNNSSSNNNNAAASPFASSATAFSVSAADNNKTSAVANNATNPGVSSSATPSTNQTSTNGSTTSGNNNSSSNNNAATAASAANPTSSVPGNSIINRSNSTSSSSGSSSVGGGASSGQVPMTVVSNEELQGQFHALRRLVASKAGFAALTALPGSVMRHWFAVRGYRLGHRLG